VIRLLDEDPPDTGGGNIEIGNRVIAFLGTGQPAIK
jgi:hypothetical protein